MTDAPTPSGEIQLIQDDDGIAVIGEPGLVERFCSSLALTDKTPVRELNSRMAGASGLLQAGSTIAENSGRWMKLTEESAAAAKKFNMMTNSATGNRHATLLAQNGGIAKNLQFVSGPGSTLTNPAVLTGGAAVMTQLAMQQMIEEITDYLESIDRKVDAVLRNQAAAVVSDLYGAKDVIDRAYRLRENSGRISAVTWSTVQNTPSTIARTRRYALDQLSQLTSKIEDEADLGDLASLMSAAEESVREWLTLLARCVQLQEKFDVLQVDRVLAENPSEVEQHRTDLRKDREHRRDEISDVTTAFLGRMDAAAQRANDKVLLHPFPSRRVVQSRNQIVTGVVSFQESLGLLSAAEAVEARRWRSAVGEAKDAAIAGAVKTGNRFSRGVKAFRSAFTEDEPSGDQAALKDVSRRAALPEPSQDEAASPASAYPDQQN